MKTLFAAAALLLAASLTGCAGGPPKTPQENQTEANRTGKVPDNLRDQRPETAPMGPLFMPMR